ncbi:LOB domain-containing protein 21 [Camellia lanceoleosa]|uniref:LOB domain-containing protein 21 n=1 Tax=Camellia lanceoleosa TaxID=1840588 RepID=A0ACC0H3F4_9ERIC|nr:LOB domain-containing protein 21 [Camellia lanceoleosa]
MKGQEPRSSSSCAACKFLKRRCSPNCLFAPYFRSDEPKKFAKVHKVFGASNVSKILIEVPEEQREDTVNSLVFEAEARLRDPVYGCIGAIALLQKKMVELQHDLAIARTRLARYVVAKPSHPHQHQHQHQHHPLLFLDDNNHDHIVVSPLVDLPGVCSDGWVESFNQNSLESYQGGSMSELSQFPFPL